MAFTDKVLTGSAASMTIGGVDIVCGTSFTISDTAAQRDLTCFGHDGYTSVGQGVKTWTATIEGMMNLGTASGYGYAEMLSAYDSGEEVSMIFEITDGSNAITRTGTAIIVEAPTASTPGENLGYTISLAGVGALVNLVTEA